MWVLDSNNERVWVNTGRAVSGIRSGELRVHPDSYDETVRIRSFQPNGKSEDYEVSGRDLGWYSTDEAREAERQFQQQVQAQRQERTALGIRNNVAPLPSLPVRGLNSDREEVVESRTGGYAAMAYNFINHLLMGVPEQGINAAANVVRENRYGLASASNFVNQVANSVYDNAVPDFVPESVREAGRTVLTSPVQDPLQVQSAVRDFIQPAQSANPVMAGVGTGLGIAGSFAVPVHAYAPGNLVSRVAGVGVSSAPIARIAATAGDRALQMGIVGAGFGATTSALEHLAQNQRETQEGLFSAMAGGAVQQGIIWGALGAAGGTIEGLLMTRATRQAQNLVGNTERLRNLAHSTGLSEAETHLLMGNGEQSVVARQVALQNINKNPEAFEANLVDRLGDAIEHSETSMAQLLNPENVMPLRLNQIQESLAGSAVRNEQAGQALEQVGARLFPEQSTHLVITPEMVAFEQEGRALIQSAISEANGKNGTAILYRTLDQLQRKVDVLIKNGSRETARGLGEIQQSLRATRQNPEIFGVDGANLSRELDGNWDALLESATALQRRGLVVPVEGGNFAVDMGAVKQITGNTRTGDDLEALIGTISDRIDAHSNLSRFYETSSRNAQNAMRDFSRARYANNVGRRFGQALNRLRSKPPTPEDYVGKHLRAFGLRAGAGALGWFGGGASWAATVLGLEVLGRGALKGARALFRSPKLEEAQVYQLVRELNQMDRDLGRLSGQSARRFVNSSRAIAPRAGNQTIITTDRWKAFSETLLQSDAAVRKFIDSVRGSLGSLRGQEEASGPVPSGMVSYLENQVPRPTQTDPLTNEVVYSQRDVEKFVNVLAVATNPANAFVAFADGSITPEQIETMRQVFPAQWQRFHGDVMNAVAEVGELSHNQRMLVFRAFGATDESAPAPMLAPSSVQMLQSAYALAGQAQRQQRVNRSPNIAQVYMNPDRRAG